MSSPVRANPSGTSSPGFRSQKKLSAGTIMKKIQTLEDTIESLRQQLVFTRSEEEQISNAISKRKTNTNPKQPKEPKEPKQPKETKAATEDKDKIPMPWTGLADFATCVGLKAQYGLFIQCGKPCNATSGSFQIDNNECRFCNECAKKCDENGKHPVGTIEERIEAGVGKYVNAKTGKKETAYIEVLEKMGITKEQALESAQKRGFQIPDWMLEKTEKKRGRPGKNTENVASESVTEKQEKQEKPKKEPKQKEPKQKQPPRSKKTASVTTFDTPQKVSTTKDSAQSSVCIDLNDVATVATVAAVTAAAPQEKKKRGRPTKSNTENNVDVDEMQQLIIQATTEKKKRLSLDAEVMPSDESEKSLHPETQLIFNGEENKSKSKSEDVESDEVFEMFDEMIRSEEQEQQVVKEDVKEDVKEPAKKKKVSEEAAAAKEAAKKKKELEAAAKEAAKEAAKKKKEEEAAAKESAKESAKKKKEEEAAAKESAKEAAKKKEEETEDEDENEDEDDEELECEEYEYEGETYGLAPNGDIYSQDGDLVGKLTNGVPKMFD
jgi:hypothetical protein